MRLKQRYGAAAVLLLALTGSGCMTHSSITRLEPEEVPTYRDADLIQTNYNAVDYLLRGRHGETTNNRVLVATVVDLDNLDGTSTFGRLTGEILATRLVHHGFAVVHMNLRRDEVLINPQGEFLLSRNMHHLAEDFNATAVLVSTYAQTTDKVYVSVKLVNAADGALLAATDYELPKGRRTRALLGEHSTRKART
ncbi:MAG TPA: FlgO family outer membrane protein [Phycisphaerae bacterium]|nr:hypothetical protein [Phycisphaerales bacterium]HRX87419.1 FlgO family outer membrane protein [Phycisphaerae bacterium]